MNSERGRCITDRRESCIGFCDDQSFARVNLWSLFHSFLSSPRNRFCVQSERSHTPSRAFATTRDDQLQNIGHNNNNNIIIQIILQDSVYAFQTEVCILYIPI